ncbi:hypothetical protein MaudCBS49596_002288 [Microsporum audouinii]
MAMPLDGRKQSQLGGACKLKGSCDSCAASKVRCSKEKPTCSRCAKTGSSCLYSPARRIGRPHQHQTTTAAKRGSPKEPTDLTDTQEVGASDTPPSYEQTASLPLSRSCATMVVSPTPTIAVATETTATISAEQQQKQQSPESHDCFHLIVDLLLDLETRPRRLAGPGLANAMLRQLACTLICECALRQDILLLVVAGSHAVLDCIVNDMGHMSSVETDLEEKWLQQVASLAARLAHRSSSLLGDSTPERTSDNAIPGLLLELKLKVQEAMNCVLEQRQRYRPETAEYATHVQPW